MRTLFVKRLVDDYSDPAAAQEALAEAGGAHVAGPNSNYTSTSIDTTRRAAQFQALHVRAAASDDLTLEPPAAV